MLQIPHIKQSGTRRLLSQVINVCSVDDVVVFLMAQHNGNINIKIYVSQEHMDQAGPEREGKTKCR